MQAKQIKMRGMADIADKCYAESIETLQQIQSEWENKMHDYLEVIIVELSTKFLNLVRRHLHPRSGWLLLLLFQMAEHLETDRIIALRNELWEHCNLISCTCVIDDEVGQFVLQGQGI